jgi:hypothetical protein
MDTSTAIATDAMLDEFDLDITFVESGLEGAGAGSDPCTGDGCGGTEDSAGVTC